MSWNIKHIGDPSSDRYMVFLHEGLGSVGLWKTFPEDLCKAVHAYGIVYDRAGYGASSGSLKERGMDYLHRGADELVNLISQEVPLEKELILYGHSDGGSIVLIYASLSENRAHKVITEAAHVFVEEETVAGVQAARPLFAQGKFDGLQKYHGERYEDVFFAWNDIWLTPEFRSWNITELLSRITIPSLIIQGEADQYGTLDQVNQITQKTTGESTPLILPNCGHAPHKTNPDDVITSVQSFLQL